MKSGKKLTFCRQKIVDVIEKSPVPLNASQIFRYLDGTIHLATIYRSLQYLEAQDYIHGFTLNCKKQGITRFYYLFGECHLYFLHCRECHRFFPYNDCRLTEIQEEIRKNFNFTVSQHVLYFLGTCESCGKAVGIERK